jgi:hypothetical protein
LANVTGGDGTMTATEQILLVWVFTSIMVLVVMMLMNDDR